MKKILLLCCAVLLAMTAKAQMTYVDNSFKDTAAGNIELGQGGMGVTNMLAETIDWPLDADGDDNVALLIVQFENMSPKDIKNVGVNLGNSGYFPSKTETRTINNQVTGYYFIPSNVPYDVILSHQKFGQARIPNVKLDTHHIYQAKVRNAATVNVAITSTPEGATVYFDSEKQPGVTPLTIPDVMMGQHNISLLPANYAVADVVQNHTVEVSSTQTAFNYNMLKYKKLTLQADPSNASLEVSLNDRVIAKGIGRLVLDSLRYENVYKVTGSTGPEETLVQNITINEDTPDIIPIKVNGSKSIAFLAKYDNRHVNGATILIDNRRLGYTPCDTVLDFGTYKIQATYNGMSKTQKLTVNKNTNGNFEIKVPTKKGTAWNPFDIEYQQREWGIAAYYISRYFSMSSGSVSHKFTWDGKEGANNGFQVGIAYQPYFGYGQGLNTGIYYQGTIVDTGTENYYDSDTGTSFDLPSISHLESSLFIPLQYQFRLPLHHRSSIAVNAGVGMTIGISNSRKGEYDNTSVDLGYGYNSDLNQWFPERFDYSLLFGVALQYRALQLDAKISRGLRNHHFSWAPASGEIGGETFSYKCNMLMIGLSLLW